MRVSLSIVSVLILNGCGDKLGDRILNTTNSTNSSTTSDPSSTQSTVTRNGNYTDSTTTSFPPTVSIRSTTSSRSGITKKTTSAPSTVPIRSTTLSRSETTTDTTTSAPSTVPIRTTRLSRSRIATTTTTSAPSTVPIRTTTSSPSETTTNAIAEASSELDDAARNTALGIQRSLGSGWHRVAAHITDHLAELANLRLSQNQAITFWNTLGGPFLLRQANRYPSLSQESFNPCTVMMMLVSRMSLPADRDAFFNQTGITEFVNGNRENLVREGLGREVDRSDFIGSRERRVSMTSPGYWIGRFPQLVNTPALRRKALILRILEYTLANDANRMDFGLNVNRARPLETSFRAISEATASDLRGKIRRVSYDNELAIGQGLIREWFSLIAAAVSFRQTPDTGVPLLSPRGETNFDEIVRNNGVSIDQYNSLGRLLAVSIINGYPLGFNLPAVFYKKLLGQAIVLEDVRDLLSVAEVNSIQYVMDATRSDDELADISAPLMHSGSRDDVSLANRDAQFASMIDNICTNSSPEKSQAITDGFLSVIPRELLESLTPEDIRSFIRGNGDIDIADFRLHYNVGHGYVRNSRQIGWLFTVLEEYDQHMRRQFLRFVTGRSILPTGGFGNLGTLIGIDRKQRLDNSGSVALPTTHTCFHSIDLPEYESLDELRRKLTTAIEYDAAGSMEG